MEISTGAKEGLVGFKSVKGFTWVGLTGMFSPVCALLYDQQTEDRFEHCHVLEFCQRELRLDFRVNNKV